MTVSDKKIRLLYTIPNFDTAGSGKVVYDLVKNLDKTKFEIEIACAHDRGEFFKTVETLGVPIHIFDTTTPYRPFHNLFFRIRSLVKFIKGRRYDLVHSWQWSSDWTEGLATRLAGAQWIYTKKAMGYRSKHWKIKSYLANFIITTNIDMASYFPYKKNQALIPFGLDTNYFSPHHFKVNKPEETAAFHVITVANLVPIKGIEVLIKAVHHLQDPNIVLTVVGDNDNAYGKELKNLCKSLSLSDNVHFLGKKMDVRPFLAQSDLYVIPTSDKGEGMPMALIEAMSMGIPVLGSDISGINYVLNKFPELLFEPANYIKLAQQIAQIRSLTVKERSELGNKMRTYCLGHFAMDHFITAHERLYREILGDS